MLTAEQRAERRKYLTASDLPVIFGYGYGDRSPADIVLDKRGLLEDDNRSTAAQRHGLFVEKPLIAWAADKMGMDQNAIDYQVWAVAPNGIMAATLDAVERRRFDAFEAKTEGCLNPRFNPSEWGEEGSSDVPPRVLMQVAGQMIAVPTLRRVLVPALVGMGAEPRCYEVVRDHVRDLVQWVEDEAMAWWNKHVQKNIPVPEKPSAEAIERLRKIDELPPVEVEPDLIRRLFEARRAAKVAEEEEKNARTILLSAMGHHRVAVASGGWAAKNGGSTRRSVDMEKLKTEHAEVYAACLRETRVNSLRITGATEDGA